MNDLSTIEGLIARDIRFEMFERAVHYVEYEMVPGDIHEFGVYTGRSLALLSYAYSTEKSTSIHGTDFVRECHGYDSFEGLQGSSHPRWKDGLFKFNHSYHPFLKDGDRVTEAVVYDLFDFYFLHRPVIHTIDFFTENEDLEKIVGKCGIIHIDCDTKSATYFALSSCRKGLTNGTIILFDDWYNLKASANDGEQGGFSLFREKNPNIEFTEWQSYATFGKSFIVTNL